MIKEVDLYTVQKADLDFETPFHLIMKRNVFAQALVTYFNVEFTKCHERVSFSTSPESQSTHWKQTVFYFEESIKMMKGEECKGTFSLQSNEQNNHDFRIGIKLNGGSTEAHEEHVYQMR